jgi:hypothetical protein
MINNIFILRKMSSQTLLRLAEWENNSTVYQKRGKAETA